MAIANIATATATAIDQKVNVNSEHSNKNRRTGPINTNWGGGTRLVYASPGFGLTRAGN